MSSKNAQGQGRRTPLTLNPQGKSVPQQQMKQQMSENRGKQAAPVQQQQQKQQQEKKETVNNVAAASAAGPVPAEKTVTKQQQNTNMKNGLNGSESKANSNGNKAATVESKKEVETRSKPAEEQQQQQQVKNGGDVAAKAAFANNSGNAAQRKQQQKQITPQIQPQQQQQQKAQANKSTEEKIVDEKKEQVAEAIVVVNAENAKTNDKTPTKKSAAAAVAAVATPKKVEEKQEQQTAAKTTATPTKPIDNANQPAVMPSPVVNVKSSPMKKRTVTSAVDVAEMDGGSPQKTADKKTAYVENPNATSTPGKLSKPIESINPMTPIGSSARISAISARPSIRTFNDLTPSKFDNYRSPRGELDMSTNTSMNVTVGSEPDNTSWFSLRSRKRERTPTSIENVHDELLSPQKRARAGGIFGIMASPFIALRSRFAKASIEQVTYEDQEKNVSMGEEVSMNEIEDDTPPASENVNDQEEEHIVEDKTEEIKKPIEIDPKLQADLAKSERCNIM